MRPRFQADANFNRDIITGLIRLEPSVDFSIADHAHFRSLPDNKVLLKAADDNRILVTHDHRTMPEHFGKFVLVHTCPGVFIVPQNLPAIAAIEAILLIWVASEHEEWNGRIVYLPL